MNPLVPAPPVPTTEDINIGASIGHYRYYNVPRWMGRIYERSGLQKEETYAPATAGETVITSDEISLERMSLTRGRITIALTDEEARRIKGLDEEAAQQQK